MPLQRRLPKVGFRSTTASLNAEIRLHELAKIDAEVVDIEALKQANLIRRDVKWVKVIASGEINKAVTTRGLAATKGARAAIEAAGGKVEG